jgi:DNA-binding NarL/FixJ family response regulator
MALRVLVVALGSMAQAGLAALVEATPGLEVAASLGTAAATEAGGQLEADVCLVDLERARDADEVVRPLVDALPWPVVVVTEPEGFAAARAAGALGAVTPSIPVSTLVAALEAARLGVSVTFPPDTTEAVADIADAGLGAPVPAAVAVGGAIRPVEVLTPRELEVLRLLAEGLTNQGLGARLGISEHTAKFHVSAVLGKLGAQSRAEAVTQGYRLGLITV